MLAGGLPEEALGTTELSCSGRKRGGDKEVGGARGRGPGRGAEWRVGGEQDGAAMTSSATRSVVQTLV